MGSIRWRRPPGRAPPPSAHAPRCATLPTSRSPRRAGESAGPLACGARCRPRKQCGCRESLEAFPTCPANAARAPGTPGRARQGATPRKGTGLARGVVAVAGRRTAQHASRDAASARRGGATERKREQACAKVRQGELSRARHVLTAAELAPGTEATWDALTDFCFPAKRPPEARAAPPQHLLQYRATRPLVFTRGGRSATGSASGVGGGRLAFQE